MNSFDTDQITQLSYFKENGKYKHLNLNHSKRTAVRKKHLYYIKIISTSQSSFYKLCKHSCKLSVYELNGYSLFSMRKYLLFQL